MGEVDVLEQEQDTVQSVIIFAEAIFSSSENRISLIMQHTGISFKPILPKFITI